MVGSGATQDGDARGSGDACGSGGAAAGSAVRRAPLDPVNEVRLRGRWTAAQERVLPSGDELVTARVIVTRPGGGVDTLDCALWRAGLRRRAVQLAEGTVVDVVGSLRRRFWRAPGGAASRYEVEVHELRTAGRRSRAPTPDRGSGAA